MIGYPNLIDSATLSGGAWATTLPRANLQNRIIGRVARTSDATLASTKFDATYAVAKNIRAISLVNHNFSLAGLVRIRGASDAAFATVLYDSGWSPVWPAVYTTDSLEWEDDNWWSGQYTDEQRSGYMATYTHILVTNIRAQYWRVEIDDTTNAAGYVQIGRVFIGPVWQPLLHMGYNNSVSWETKTGVQEAIGGTEYFQRRTPYRVTVVPIPNMSIAEGLGNAFEIQRRAGVDGEVFFIFDPDDTIHALRRQYLGRLRTLSPIQYPYVNNHSTMFEIKELL